jgi:putative hydroxymethylpyrimidine transport system substrate-binding protein
MRSFNGVLAGTWIAIVLLSGCGAQDVAETTEGPPAHAWKTREVNVSLDQWENPANAGIVLAERKGFERVGLKVTTFAPAQLGVVIKDVVDGADEFGISHMPQVVLAQEKGAPIVVVGSLIPKATAAMIWLKKSHIGDIADLEGKTIAIPGLPFQKAFLQSALARSGLALDDVKVESVGYDLVPALVSGRADAIFGGSANLEGARLEKRGMEPVVTPVQDLGIPDYDELVLIARRDLVDEDPQLVRAFNWAVGRGTATALMNPKGAAGVIDESVESTPGVGLKTTNAEVKATFPLLSRSGYTDPNRASQLVDWMFEEGMIQRKPPVSELLTNDYLASQP